MYTGVEVLSVGDNECTIRCLEAGNLLYVYTDQGSVLPERRISSRVSAGEVLNLSGRPVFVSVTGSSAYTVTESGIYVIAYTRSRGIEEGLVRLSLRRNEKLPYGSGGWVLRSATRTGLLPITRARPTLGVTPVTPPSGVTPSIPDASPQPNNLLISDLMHRTVRNVELRDRALSVEGVSFDIVYYEEQPDPEQLQQYPRAVYDQLMEALDRIRPAQQTPRFRLRNVYDSLDDAPIESYNNMNVV